MEFFRDKNIYIALAVYTLLMLLPTGREVDQSAIQQGVSIVSGAIGLAINFYFLKFITDGTKTNRKSPYNEVPFNAWSYIWRIALLLWLFPLVLIPLMLFFPASMLPVLGTVWFLIVNNIFLFLLFCRNKKQKIIEFKAIFGGISL